MQRLSHGRLRAIAILFKGKAPGRIWVLTTAESMGVESNFGCFWCVGAEAMPSLSVRYDGLLIKRLATGLAYF